MNLKSSMAQSDGTLSNSEDTKQNSNNTSNNRNSNPTTNNNSKNDLLSSSSSTTSNHENDDNFTESKAKIGEEFQADLTYYDPKNYLKSRDKIIEKETAIWRPSNKIDEKQLNDYINEACTKHSYNIEQALGLLFWHKHNIEKALQDMKKYVPRPNDWTQEEKILFEQAYYYNGKNFTKIKQVLPDKSQSSLVNYYYTWKKTRLFTSQIENHQTNSKNSNNLDSNYMTEATENGNLDDIEANNSDDNDSVDDSFNSNVNKICCNCDLITTDLQSTPKGLLCNPCYTYWKDTGGLMRPDHLINKTSNYQQNPNHLQNNTFRTNRYLNITNNEINGTNNGNNSNNANITSNGSNSREARNFHKSLRKPPKGIYLNYEELLDLVKTGPNTVFEDLNRKIISLKKQTQSNKQEIENLIKTIANECEPLKSEINNLLFKNDEEELTPNPFWSQKEIKIVLLGFNKFGDDFEAISQLLLTKSQDSIKAFYNYYKEHLNLDKLVNNNTRELNKRATSILNDLKKNHRPDIQISKIAETTNSEDIIIL